MNHALKQTMIVAAMALALGATAARADDTTNSQTQPAAKQSMTGKQKATTIGAGSGAVAGAVVGGPIGAVVGAGIGAVVGHEGTDANGHVSTSDSTAHHRMNGMNSKMDSQVSKAQSALNGKGYTLSVDGHYGPNTENAVRDFQSKNGLTASGTLDDATLNALGVRG